MYYNNRHVVHDHSPIYSGKSVADVIRELNEEDIALLTFIILVCVLVFLWLIV
jgi:hypothetical protein